MAFKNVTLSLPAALTTVYTCPAGKEAVIHAIFVTPLVDDTTVTIKAGSPGNTGHVGKDIPLVAGGSLYYPKPVNLAENEIIEAQTVTNDDCEIFLSILEQAQS